MIVEYEGMTLNDLRNKLLEAKEILRYLNDRYHIDKCEEEPIYYKGSECLSKAASFVSDMEDFLEKYGEYETCEEDDIFYSDAVTEFFAGDSIED